MESVLVVGRRLAFLHFIEQVAEVEDLKVASTSDARREAHEDDDHDHGHQGKTCRVGEPLDSVEHVRPVGDQTLVVRPRSGQVVRDPSLHGQIAPLTQPGSVPSSKS